MPRTKNSSGRPITHPVPRNPDRGLGRSSDMNNAIPCEMLNAQLMELIPGGDIAHMNRLMTIGANPNATCCLNHVSACHIAAMYDNDALDLLLRSGAASSRCDQQGRTPFHLAAWAGNVKHIASLLKFPEDLRKRVEELFISSTIDEVKKHCVPVNEFINIRCHPSKVLPLPDGWGDGVDHTHRNVLELLPSFQLGWTPLHAASAHARHHCVQLLLAAGADASAQDQLCRTPLDVAGCAHYNGHKIDINNFEDTVEILLDAGGKFLRYYMEKTDTLLHTAVELESEAVVERILHGGASTTAWNSHGLTAMHICVKKRNKKLLQLAALDSVERRARRLLGDETLVARLHSLAHRRNIASLSVFYRLCAGALRSDPTIAPFTTGLPNLIVDHKRSNPNQDLPTVNAKDQSGTTVLCAAVEAEWKEGVCIALGAGATNMKANEESSMGCITEKFCNRKILQEDNPLTNECTRHNGYTFRTCNQQSFTNNLRSGETNVLHLAVKLGNKDILECLLDYSYKKTNTIKLIDTSDRFGPPLYYALVYNQPECARLLISKGARVKLLDCSNINCKNNEITKTSLLHIAAIKNHHEIAEMIIKHDRETVHAIVAGRTPLHEACSRGNKEMIKLLLRYGADLSGSANVNETYYFAQKRQFVPIDLLMNNVSKPTEFMQEIFDSYITSKGQDSNCEVEVDYRVLFPKPDMKHMAVIKALNNTGNRYDQDRLLLHPLVQSFLYLKWRSLLSFFYVTLVLHVCFVFSLNVFALSLFWYKDKKLEPVPSIFRCNVWIYIIYLTACLLTIQEIIDINMKSKRYLLSLETAVKCLSTTLAIILPQVVSWDSKPNPEWVRLFGSATLLVTWVRMMFLLSRLPDYGYYVLMYGKVATKVFKILVSFGFLILGFSICFMIQFHAQPPFDGPWSSLLTTMVMMTSEFGYNELINAKRVEDASASLIMIRLTFVLFLVIVSIILMNLLVGVAVNDVNSLEIIGKLNRLEKQLQFITSFEDIGCQNFIKKILPTNLYKRWFKNTRWENRIVLHPREATRSNGHILHSHLKEAIFENVHLQKRQSDEVQDTMLYQMKLDDIHKVIVKKDGGKPHKSDGPEITLNKLAEDINKIRSDIEMIKNFIDTTTHRNQT